MSEDKTGGPAFPAHTIAMHEGMTLRDYFAAKAMQGILAGELATTELATITRDCYAIADAMLEERES